MTLINTSLQAREWMFPLTSLFNGQRMQIETLVVLSELSLNKSTRKIKHICIGKTLSIGEV